MIYLLTYFLLDRMGADSSWFAIFWGIIVGEFIFAIIGGFISAYNERNK